MKDGGQQNVSIRLPACAHDSNEVPTALLMFPGSGSKPKLTIILCKVRVDWDKKMAAGNRSIVIS